MSHSDTNQKTTYSVVIERTDEHSRLYFAEAGRMKLRQSDELPRNIDTGQLLDNLDLRETGEAGTLELTQNTWVFTPAPATNHTDTHGDL